MTTDTITAEQCAELLGCTEDTVEELSRKGELPGLKFGRGWVFVRADLLAYLAERGRQEAEQRRADRGGGPQSAPNVRPIKPRRQPPPALPKLSTA
ncbi:DNA binding, excisionase family domain protein [Delftia acidovorans]|uniref:helix-turn-helix domain-containing protein n=1 Tax=Delftia acidovorans TaxID=80866 RepID=UPI000503D806|nr:helix-turn-helix domain-containing protein [Delftia acidovorans]KFJ13224.1 DNA binding, excisionase family domain protein [Delftia acidovorans]QQB53402.1 helix-turn-helix domain-containing protein [Delftia acidovorans]